MIQTKIKKKLRIKAGIKTKKNFQELDPEKIESNENMEIKLKLL